MFRFFRKHRKVVFVALVFVIAGLLLFGVGSSSFVTSSQDAVVKVNGIKISQSQFDRMYNQMARREDTSNPAKRQQLMGQALNELIRQEVMYEEAKDYGIMITDQELQEQIAVIPLFQREGRFSKELYQQALRQVLTMTAQDFEKGLRKEIAARRLNQLLVSAVQISNRETEEGLQARLAAEKDAKKRQELVANPNKVREEIRNSEANLIFSDWLSQLNARLKVDVVSEPFRQRLNGPAQ